MIIAPDNDQLYKLLDILEIINQYLDNKTLECLEWHVNKLDNNVVLLCNNKNNSYTWESLFMSFVIPCILYIEHYVSNGYNLREIVITKRKMIEIYDYIDPFVVKDIMYNKNQHPIDKCYDIAIDVAR